LREISTIKGIDINLFSISCAHECRYCFFDNHKCAKSAFSRFSLVVERFLDWRKTQNIPNFHIIFRRFYCDDVDAAILKKEDELAAACSRGSYRPLYLEGLRMRPERELRNWLQQLRDIGVKTAYVSFAGYGDVHDYWNRRKGDFDFLMNAIRIAADLGMIFHQRLFLMKSTLPTLGTLIDKLDTLPGKVKSREIYPLFYTGRAGRLEDERVTKDDLEHLPERVTKFFANRKNWHSEQEWMDIIRKEQEPPLIKILMQLYLDDTNIDRIESMSCEAILEDWERRTRAAYNMLPAPRELCEESGDAANTRLYQNRPDIERLWLNRYLKKHPLLFERQLTYLAMND
jgi:hypothetical protein